MLLLCLCINADSLSVQALVIAVHQPVFTDLRLSVAGVIFLGAPFQGSDVASAGKWLARLLRSDPSLSESLEKDDPRLHALSRDFWGSHSDWDLVCFYEKLEADDGPWKAPVVSSQSASLLGKRMMFLNTDHSGLNKLGGKDDKIFALVLPEIRRMIEGGPSIVAHRHRAKGTEYINLDMKKKDTKAFQRIIRLMFVDQAKTLVDDPLNKIPLPDIQQHQAGQKASWIVPFGRNHRFTSHESELAQLEEKLFAEGQTPRIAIRGLGGVGKTKLVLELIYRTSEKHEDCSVIWIPAINAETLQQAYLDVAQQLETPGWKEEKADVKRLVQGYLSNESAGRWLLVFDNVDNLDMWIDTLRSGRAFDRLIDWLPRSKQGCIVFTTRDRKTAVKFAHQDVVKVLEMNENVAMQLLQNCLMNRDLVNNEQDTKTLLVKLTFLPLAIFQAAAYINENSIVFADYLSLLED
ncbi:MAG: hypothetical protein M1818_004780 [Claussenomyces sp. TS43310]|nr:MAG: hypothetical protein M1818_004780 [Claussenomyces sp. TS43310]